MPINQKLKNNNKYQIKTIMIKYVELLIYEAKYDVFCKCKIFYLRSQNLDPCIKKIIFKIWLSDPKIQQIAYILQFNGLPGWMPKFILDITPNIDNWIINHINPN